MTTLERLEKQYNEYMTLFERLCANMNALSKQIQEEKFKQIRDAEAGTYKGQTTYCPVNGLDCPYYKNGVCHIDDPFADCDDWCSACGCENWEEWEEL